MTASTFRKANILGHAARAGLLDRDDHLVVMRPNYATNLETPRAIGCAISSAAGRFSREVVM